MYIYIYTLTIYSDIMPAEIIFVSAILLQNKYYLGVVNAKNYSKEE